jgi:hypothetical protein
MSSIISRLSVWPHDGSSIGCACSPTTTGSIVLVTTQRPTQSKKRRMPASIQISKYRNQSILLRVQVDSRSEVRSWKRHEDFETARDLQPMLCRNAPKASLAAATVIDNLPTIVSHIFLYNISATATPVSALARQQDLGSACGVCHAFAIMSTLSFISLRAWGRGTT